MIIILKLKIKNFFTIFACRTLENVARYQISDNQRAFFTLKDLLLV